MNETKTTQADRDAGGTVGYVLTARGRIGWTAIWAAVAAAIGVGGGLLSNQIVHQVGPSIEARLADLEWHCKDTKEEIKALMLRMRECEKR